MSLSDRASGQGTGTGRRPVRPAPIQHPTDTTVSPTRTNHTADMIAVVEPRWTCDGIARTEARTITTITPRTALSAGGTGTTASGAPGSRPGPAGHLTVETDPPELPDAPQGEAHRRDHLEDVSGRHGPPAHHEQPGVEGRDRDDPLVAVGQSVDDHVAHRSDENARRDRPPAVAVPADQGVVAKGGTAPGRGGTGRSGERSGGGSTTSTAARPAGTRRAVVTTSGRRTRSVGRRCSRSEGSASPRRGPAPQSPPPGRPRPGAASGA